MTSHRVVFFTAGSPFGSAKIRAHQIAERLGGAVVDEPIDLNNPPKHIVLVKVFPEDVCRLTERTTVWYDPIDTDSALPAVAKEPGVTVMAAGRTAAKYLRARLDNRVVLVPQQHCNFDNLLNERWPPRTVGYIGYEENLDLSVDVLKEELGELGLDFVWKFMDKTVGWEEATAFYRTIDINISFRKPRICSGLPPEMKNPLKIINAASFGIPTVGKDEAPFEEFPLSIQVNSLGELVAACERLQKTAPFFKPQLVDRAQEYHIDNIVRLYDELLV